MLEPRLCCRMLYCQTKILACRRRSKLLRRSGERLGLCGRLLFQGSLSRPTQSRAASTTSSEALESGVPGGPCVRCSYGSAGRVESSNRLGLATSEMQSIAAVLLVQIFE